VRLKVGVTVYRKAKKSLIQHQIHRFQHRPGKKNRIMATVDDNESRIGKVHNQKGNKKSELRQERVGFAGEGEGCKVRDLIDRVHGPWWAFFYAPPNNS
jgi:hypothetical protein